MVRKNREKNSHGYDMHSHIISNGGFFADGDVMENLITNKNKIIMPLLRNQISLQDLGNGPKGIIPTDLEKTKSVGIFAVEILKNMVKIFN